MGFAVKDPSAFPSANKDANKDAVSLQKKLPEAFLDCGARDSSAGSSLLRKFAKNSRSSPPHQRQLLDLNEVDCQKASMKGCVRLYVFDVSTP
jgi:hypothetical protein